MIWNSNVWFYICRVQGLIVQVWHPWANSTKSSESSQRYNSQCNVLQETLPECRKRENTLKMCRRNDGSNTTASTQVAALRLHRSRMADVNRQHTSAAVQHWRRAQRYRESNSSRPSTTIPPVVGLTVSVDQLTAVVHADDGLGHQNGRWRSLRTPLRQPRWTADDCRRRRRRHYAAAGLSQVEPLMAVDSTTTVQDSTTATYKSNHWRQHFTSWLFTVSAVNRMNND